MTRQPINSTVRLKPSVINTNTNSANNTISIVSLTNETNILGNNLVYNITDDNNNNTITGNYSNSSTGSSTVSHNIISTVSTTTTVPIINRSTVAAAVVNTTTTTTSAVAVNTTTSTAAPVVTSLLSGDAVAGGAVNKTQQSSLAGRRRAQPNRVRRVDLDVHQSNMLADQVARCRRVLNDTLSHDYGSRKTARLLKQELDDQFSGEKYRFSVIVTSSVDDILAKRLYGVWMSVSDNKRHYLLVASYKANSAKRLSEGQLDRIEDWANVYFITYENMSEKHRNGRVAKMLKEKLDLNYGKGNNNTWSVIALKRSTSLRAKRLFDGTPNLQFGRLDGSVWLVFRGGQDIQVPNQAIYLN